MFLPALVAKLLAAGAVAQAATGAGVVLVVATGAGATGLLGTGVQDTLASSVGADSTDSEVTKQDDVAVTDDQTADPGTVDGTEGDTTVPVEPVQETVDPETWVADGPGDNETFGAWVSASAHNDQLREWLRSQGKTFGSMVSEWAHKKGLDGADLEREGVDLDDLSDEPTPSPVTSGPGAGTDDQGDDGTQVASTHRGSGKSGSDGQGKSGGSSNGKSGNSGNGRSGNSGRGHN